MRSSVAVQWLGLHTFTAKDSDLIPGQETKLLQTIWYNQSFKKKKKTHGFKSYIKL